MLHAIAILIIYPLYKELLLKELSDSKAEMSVLSGSLSVDL